MRSNAVRQITLPELSGGINVHDPEYDIADNQSPDMLNLWYKDMALCKRPGQTWLSQRGIHRISERFGGARAVHSGTKLYRWNVEGMVRCAGEFNPVAGYPADPAAGDYRIASAAGTLRGVAYEEGDTAVYVYSGVQRIALCVTGKVIATGNLAVTVTGAGIAGSPLTVSVAVKAGDTAADAAEKLRTALAGSAAVTTPYTVDRVNRTVTLTANETGAPDDTLVMAIDGGSTGLESAASYDESVWRNMMREIKTGVADAAGVFCEFGDLLYYIDGVEIWEIGADYTAEPVKPYTPVIMINAAPDLSAGNDNEAYNLIGPGFTVWYNGTGSDPAQYYVISRTDNSFKVSATSGGTAVNILSNGTAGGCEARAVTGLYPQRTPRRIPLHLPDTASRTGRYWSSTAALESCPAASQRSTSSRNVWGILSRLPRLRTAAWWTSSRRG
jgi:hypothetical protein